MTLVIRDMLRVHQVLLMFTFLFMFFMTRLQKLDIRPSPCLLTSLHDVKMSRDAVPSQSQMMSCYMTSGYCMTSWCHVMSHAVMMPRDMTSPWDLCPYILHIGVISLCTVKIWCWHITIFIMGMSIKQYYSFLKDYVDLFFIVEQQSSTLPW